MRKTFLFVVAALLACGAARAQAPARMISGFPPGGGVDILARIFAEKWSEAIGRPAVVENRTGAGGVVGMEAVKAAAPDGNTLIVAPDSNFSSYPHTVAKPAYDPIADFTAIALAGKYAFALCVSSTVPVNDLAQFIAWAKANPKSASYGSSGAGSLLQFYGVLISETVGAPMTHVPYRGVGPAINDVAAGQLAAAVLPLGTILPQVNAGRARVLAHSGSVRSPAVPNVPTFKELGYPTLEAPGWFAIFGPARMRPEVVNRLNDMFNSALRTPSVRERLVKLDLDIQEMTPAELAAMVKADTERWGRVVKSSGWQPE